MSMGYGGYADLFESDDTLSIYKYCCFNINAENYEHYMNLKDGEIYIERDSFVEPEIHEKNKKTAVGKKHIVKRIKRDVPFESMLNTGKISVKNASGTWRMTEFGTDIMAMKLVRMIFDEYQETGIIPIHVTCYV